MTFLALIAIIFFGFAVYIDRYDNGTCIDFIGFIEIC
mgnify:CR=1 FL=1